MQIKRCDIRDLGDIIEALEAAGEIENPGLYARNTMVDTSTCLWFRSGNFFLFFQLVRKGIYSAHIVGKPDSFKDAKDFIHTVGKYLFANTDCESIWCMVDESNKRLQRLCGVLRFKRAAYFPSREIIIYEFLKSDRTEEEKICHKQQ
jgi:hypothetical protein